MLNSPHQLYPWQTEHWQHWLAQQDRLAQAYLLTGATGIGLSDFITEMSRSLLCQQSGQEVCQQCKYCHLFQQDLHPDLFKLTVLENKKNISIDQVRELNRKLFETSHQGGFKVAVIEQAEKLNINAFNALLKTIEEPPQGTIILLSSYQPSRLPATIKSRCRQLRFAKPSLEIAIAWLVKQCQKQHPQADLSLVKRALKLNWGAPVQALEWINAKGFETEQAWQTTLTQLVNGQMSVTQTVEKWQKFSSPEVVFDYFYLWAVNRIRAALYQQKLSFNPQWMHFQQAVNQAKLAWQSNANKDLVLESLCMEWLAMNQINANIPPTVFKSKLIRGSL